MSLINIDSITTNPSKRQRKPEWLRVPLPNGESYKNLKQIMRSKNLHTVCEEARCPNIGECWNAGTATFLILGDICTRSCGFCGIKTGRPYPIDWEEPERVAQAVKAMNLQHVVITSVNRDERKDGGAPIFAACIKRIREVQQGCTIEVLIPDFKGSIDALKIVMAAEPEILNHNVETVPRLFKKVQPQDKYEWALTTLGNARKLSSKTLTKSGIMVGLGEEWDEVVSVMQDLVNVGVQILTIGQYLQPSKTHLPMSRYYHPDEFAKLKQIGYKMGYKWVESGPLVRSSYHAHDQLDALLQQTF